MQRIIIYFTLLWILPASGMAAETTVRGWDPATKQESSTSQAAAERARQTPKTDFGTVVKQGTAAQSSDPDKRGRVKVRFPAPSRDPKPAND